MRSRLEKPLISGVALTVALSIAVAGTSSVVPMPGRFAGIHLGMKDEDLLKIRTNITSNWHKNLDGRAQSSPSNEVLVESYSGIDPMWGELGSTNNPMPVALGQYVIKDGKLTGFSYSWIGETNKIKQRETAFLSSCISLWGDKFEKRAIIQDRGTKGEQIAPVLLWKKDNVVIALICDLKWIPGSPNSACVLDMFYKTNELRANFYERDKFDPEVVDRVFQRIGIK